VTTANEAEGARHLRSLAGELSGIVAALGDAQRASICDVVTLSDATPEQVMRTFQSDAYRDRIAILHFAGHAGPEGLLFETADGSTAVADAGGLAAFLGCQRGLQLVVLNACATQAHVDSLREAGVGAVIATSRTVEDAVAHQFALLLYQGLGSGAGIKRAYDEAAAGVRFKHGAAARGTTVESMHASAAAATQAKGVAEPVSRAIVRKGAITTDDGRWPWDIYFRRGAEESVGPWALPEAAGNPMFGLPLLPEGDTPLETPFRHLRPFAREHAELFFGRGKDIRELYDKVTGTESEPVVLLYGATGVGKSSLLDAGLLPRLTGSFEVRYAPRDTTRGLLGTLARALGADPEGDLGGALVSAAWRQLEETCGRPLFVVVDQLEEAYTSEDAGHAAIGAAARELDAFAGAIATLFGNDATRPRGRLVLGFRKEWLSEVKGALETHRVARTEHRLEQLTRGGVLEAITGPTRVPQRRMPTRLELERDLDVQIADDLLANRASHVAPLLQILLAEMWAEAPRRDGLVRFDDALYDTVRATAKQLDAFLTQRIDALRAWHAPAVDSGLVLDYLRFHTTPKGTSDERTVDDERQAYPAADAPPPGLRAMCARLLLLVERGTDEAGVAKVDRPARLAHDTLAPLVRERFDRSDAPGPRARRILEGRAAEWSEGRTGVALDEPDLAVVEAGERGMRAWTEDEKRLVEASRVARHRARRRRAWVIRGAIAAVTVIAAFGVGSWILYRQSQARLAESTSRELGARALATDPVRRDVAFLYSVASYERAPTFEARRSLFTQLARDPHLIRVAATGASDLVFAPDGNALLLAGPGGISTLDLVTGRESLVREIAPAQMDPSTLALDRGGTAYSGLVGHDTTSLLSTIGVWDVASGRPLGQLTLPAPDGAGSVTWHVGPPDANGRRVVAVVDGNDTVLWDLASGRPGVRLRGHAEPPYRTTFGTDGSVLVTTGDDGRIIAWDVATGRPKRTVAVARRRLADVAVSRDNSTMAVMADDTLALWSLVTSRRPRRIADVDFNHVAFTEHDSALIVSARRGEVRAFDAPLADDRPLEVLATRSLLGASDIPQLVVVSAAGSRVAALSPEGTVHVWDLARGALTQRSAIPMDSASRMTALTANGKFAVAQSDTVLSVWDVAASRYVGRVRYRPSVSDRLRLRTTVDVGGAGQLVAAPARDPSHRGPRDVFDVSTGRLARAVDAPIEAGVAIDPSSARVAYGLPGTRAAVVMDLEQPGRADTLDFGIEPRDAIDSTYAPTVAFSPAGDVLVVQASQASLLVWNLANRQVRDSFIGIGMYASSVLASEDGRTVAAVQEDMVQFWRTGTPAPFARLRWTMRSETVALSPDGTLFAFDNNGTVTLVDVARGEALGQVETGGISAVGLAFVDGGRALMLVNEEGHVTRIVTDPHAWVSRACGIAGSAAAVERWVDDAPAASVPPRCEARSGRR
jgi:WD40 repeat protein